MEINYLNLDKYIKQIETKETKDLIIKTVEYLLLNNESDWVDETDDDDELPVNTMVILNTLKKHKIITDGEE